MSIQIVKSVRLPGPASQVAVPTIVPNPHGYVDLPFDQNSLCTVGRLHSSNSEIQLATYHSRVSRMHAAIRLCEDTLSIRDLGSKNGTWLWNRPQWVRLDEGVEYPLLLCQQIALGQIQDRANICIDPREALSLAVLRTGIELGWQVTTHIVE